jgi:Cation efflux family
MHSYSIDDFRHSHVFLGDAHERNERKTWAVIGICAAMMIAEIVGGLWFGSVALIADGLHMSTHAGALLIAAFAYTYSRRHAEDARLAFGTGKLGDLAAFTSAIALAMIALLIGYESVERLIYPVPIAFNQAIPIAAVGLGVNLLSAFLLRDDHPKGHAHDHDNAHDHRHDDHDHARGSGNVHRDHNFASRLCACRGRCRCIGSRHCGPSCRSAVWLGLDGPTDGLGCDSRYPKLVMDAHPICWRCPSRRLSRRRIG